MALPKRRHSTRRQGKGGPISKIKIPALVRCPACGQTTKSHQACPSCGSYKK